MVDVVVQLPEFPVARMPVEPASDEYLRLLPPAEDGRQPEAVPEKVPVAGRGDDRPVEDLERSHGLAE